jgi:hypothetical protein
MYTNDRHDVMAFRYAEELQIEAEPVPSCAWQSLVCAAVLLGLVGLVA